MSLVETVVQGIQSGNDENFGIKHFCYSNMSDYATFSYTVQDLCDMYGLNEHEAIDVIEALSHEGRS